MQRVRDDNIVQFPEREARVVSLDQYAQDLVRFWREWWERRGKDCPSSFFPNDAT
jgi:hypothetical protein